MLEDSLHEAPKSQLQYPARSKRGKKTEWYMARPGNYTDQLTITTSEEPTLSEALNATPEGRVLGNASIEEGMKSVDSSSTWVPDHALKSQPLSTQSILKVERDAVKNVQKFKRRVNARDNHQVYNKDRKQTKAPVVSFEILRQFINLYLSLGMYIGQVDVKTAILSGELPKTCVGKFTA